MKHFNLLTISFLFTSFSLSPMDRPKGGASVKAVKKDIRTLKRSSATEEEKAQAFVRTFAAASEKKCNVDEQQARQVAKNYIDKVTR